MSTSKDVKVDVRNVMEGLVPLTDAAFSCVIVYGSAQAIVSALGDFFPSHTYNVRTSVCSKAALRYARSWWP
jgi:hypothetical protein